MQFLTSLLCLAAVAPAAIAPVQPNQPRRIIGTTFSADLDLTNAGRETIDRATVAFLGADRRPEFTIDFVAQYTGVKPAAPPSVVDIVVTDHPSNDEQPDATMRVDGQPLAMNPRLKSRRSVVASIPFEDFLKLANATTIVERAFDVELEFGAEQMRMLQMVAKRWAGQ